MLEGKITFYWDSGETVERGIGQQVVGLQRKGKRPDKCKIEIYYENDDNSNLEIARFMKWFQGTICPSLKRI